MLHSVSGSWFLPKWPGVQTGDFCWALPLGSLSYTRFPQQVLSCVFEEEGSRINYRNTERSSMLKQISLCERRCGKDHRALSRMRFYLPAGTREPEQSRFWKKRFGSPANAGRWLSGFYPTPLVCHVDAPAQISGYFCTNLFTTIPFPHQCIHCASEFPTNLLFGLYLQLSYVLCSYLKTHTHIHILDFFKKNESVFIPPADCKTYMSRYHFKLVAAKLIRSKEKSGFFFFLLCQGRKLARKSFYCGIKFW